MASGEITRNDLSVVQLRAVAARTSDAKQALVLADPDPSVDGVVRWRCVDLQAVIQRR